MFMIHTHPKTKFKGQSVQKDRVKTNGRTDERYRLLHISSRNNAVGNK